MELRRVDRTCQRDAPPTSGAEEIDLHSQIFEQRCNVNLGFGSKQKIENSYSSSCCVSLAGSTIYAMPARRVLPAAGSPAAVKCSVVLVNMDHRRRSNRTCLRFHLMTTTGKLFPDTFAHVVIDSQRTHLSECLHTVRIRIERILVMVQ